MTVDWSVVATIAGPLIALPIGAWINRAFEGRPRLITYLGHVSTHRLHRDDGTPYDVYTHSVVLRNAGRRPATNVRLAHSYLPNVHVFPDVDFRVDPLPGGGREIVVPTLVPGEQITISYLYFPPITWNQVNGPIKSDDGFAKAIQVLPVQQYPAWVRRLVAGLVLSGAISLLYLGFMLVRGLLRASTG